MKVLVRGLRAFGAFWWDFLIGDSPELFVAVVFIVVLALVFHHDRIAMVVALPLLATSAVVVSALAGRTRPGREVPTNERSEVPTTH